MGVGRIERRGANKKAIAAGIIALIALAAMAMVYYSDFGTSTITVNNIIAGVYVETSNPSVWSPSMFVNKEIAKVNIRLNDPDMSVDNNTINYTAVFESPLLKLGAVRALVIKVYKDDNGNHVFDDGTDELIGMMTPLTPSLVYSTTYNESKKGPINGGKNVTYFFIASGVAFKPGFWDTAETKVGIKASVSLDSVG